jgi:hypothetical protein
VEVEPDGIVTFAVTVSVENLNVSARQGWTPYSREPRQRYRG